MPELILKVGDTGTYSDGDIICAFNDNRIKLVHAQHICDYRNLPKTDGILPARTLAQDYFELTHQYRFVREGSQVTKIDIATGQAEDVSSQMDVSLYIARRKTVGKKALFGTPFNEIWYGGRFDHTKVTEVWDKIEEKTAERRANFTKWPVTDLELKHFLTLPVDDFDDVVAADLVAPEVDETDPENPITIHKRKHKVNWKPLFARNGFSVADVENRGKKVDLRPFDPFTRASIVTQK